MTSAKFQKNWHYFQQVFNPGVARIRATLKNINGFDSVYFLKFSLKCCTHIYKSNTVP